MNKDKLNKVDYDKLEKASGGTLYFRKFAGKSGYVYGVYGDT